MPTFIVVIAAIVLCCIFIPKACSNKVKVDVTCSNATIDGNSELHTSYPVNSEVTLTFKANDGCSLPSDIKATSGNQQLVKDIDYTYSKDTGEMKFNIRGDTNIIVDALNYTMIFKSPGTEQTVGFDCEGTFASVDWGDGTVDSNKTHTYAAVPKDTEYYICIKGSQMTSFWLSIDYPVLVQPGNVYISNVVIPSGTNKIRDFAFACLDRNLTSVIIPDSVTSIGKYAFYYATITSIIIPDSVTSIDYGAFCCTDSLKYVVLSKNITSIPEWGFTRCGFSNIAIPNSVTSIGEYAFYNINANAVVDMSDVDHLIPLTGDIFTTSGYGCFVGTIKVKTSLLDTYKNADYWKNSADRFVGV